MNEDEAPDNRLELAYQLLRSLLEAAGPVPD